MGEVAWPSTPMPAVLLWTGADRGAGYLHFIDPAGDYAVVPVTRGATYTDKAAQRNVWHIEDDGGELVTTTPSVHYVRKWHSPYTTTWRIVSREPFDQVAQLRELVSG